MRVEVLAEDAESRRFAEGVLTTFGFSRRELYVEPISGGGSKKAWVTESYPRLVRKLRARSYQKNLVLVVISDADELTVQHRCQQLDNALGKTGQSKRSTDDRIVLWIPKWHIETWYLYFNTTGVVETRAYKAEFRKQIASAERENCHQGFVGEYRSFLASSEALTSMPSLLAAYRESAGVAF